MTETIYDEVDSWPLVNGDKVIVIESEIWEIGPGGVAIDCRYSYHWNVVAKNGQKVEIGGETYTRKATAIEAALRHHPRVDVSE